MENIINIFMPVFIIFGYIFSFFCILFLLICAHGLVCVILEVCFGYKVEYKKIG